MTPKPNRPQPSASGPTEPLRHNADFRRFALGQSLTHLGDSITNTALPMVVLAATGSGTTVAALSSLQQLPQMLLGIPAGVFVDRWNRKALLWRTSTMRGVVLLAAPLALALGLGPAPVFFTLAIPLSILGLTYQAAYAAAMPSLVGAIRAAEATAYLNSMGAVCAVLGTAAAGVMVVELGTVSTLTIGAALIPIAGLCIYRIVRPLNREPTVSSQGLVQSMRAGLRFLFEDRNVGCAAALAMISTGLHAAFLPTLTTALLRDDALAPATFGLLAALYMAGGAVGAVIGGRFITRRFGPSMAAAQLLAGVSMLALVATSSLAGRSVAIVLIGSASAVSHSAYLTVRARFTPDELLGRVASWVRSAMFGLGMLVTVLAGLAADQWDGFLALELIGGSLIVLAISALLSPPFHRIGATA